MFTRICVGTRKVSQYVLYHTNQRSASIFISYAHSASKDRAQELSDFINKNGHETILDVNNFKQDVVGSITKGFEADIFMPILTYDYNNSKTCEQEMKSAWDRQKPFVPVVDEEGYTFSDDIKTMMNTKLYTNIYNKSIENDCGKQLLKQINDIDITKAPQPVNDNLSKVEVLKYAEIQNTDKHSFLELVNSGKQCDCIITIVGDSYSGKSTLTNAMLQYFGYNSAFPVRRKLDKDCTKGIDMTIIKFNHQILTLRDCEGLTHIGEHSLQQELLQLSYVTSDILIWNLSDISSILTRQFLQFIEDLQFIEEIKPVLFILIRNDPGFSSLQSHLKDSSILNPLTRVFTDVIPISLPQPSTIDIENIDKNIFMNMNHDNDESRFKLQFEKNLKDYILERMNFTNNKEKRNVDSKLD